MFKATLTAAVVGLSLGLVAIQSPSSAAPLGLSASKTIAPATEVIQVGKRGGGFKGGGFRHGNKHRHFHKRHFHWTPYYYGHYAHAGFGCQRYYHNWKVTGLNQWKLKYLGCIGR